MNSTPHISEARENQFFRGVEPLVRKPGFHSLTFVGFHPFLVAGPRSKVVHDVKKAEAVCQDEHDLVSVFRHSDFAGHIRQALCEIFSDQVQIVTPGIEPENWHLVAPFFDFAALLFWKHPHVVRYECCSYFGPDVPPAPLQLFHELADQLCQVFFTNVCGLSLNAVPDAHRNRHVCVLDHEHTCRLFPLIFVAVRFEVVQDRVWEALRLRSWQLHIYFPYLTRPCLDHSVARGLELSCAFYSCFEPVFSCLFVARNYFVTIVRKTFSASVPVAAVVLKYSPCLVVVPVDRSALNPSLAAVPTHCMVNMNFPPLGFS